MKTKNKEVKMDLPTRPTNNNNNEPCFNPTKIYEKEYIAPRSVYKGQCATFQASMKLTVTIGQCFGLNPVLGVSEMDPSKLRFKFWSWRCFYSVISIMAQLSIVILCVLKMSRQAESSLSSNKNGGMKTKNKEVKMDLPTRPTNNNNNNEPCFNPTKIYEKEYIAPRSVYKGQCATFQASMKLTVTIGQCFGLNPVLGVSEMDPSKLRFKFWSWRCFYSVISIMAQLSIVILCVLKMFRQAESSLSSNTFLVFSGTNCLTTILFFRISTKWPRLCQHIAKTEVVDPNMDAYLVRRCNAFCIIILSLALVEHLLSDLSTASTTMDGCFNQGYRGFITQSFPWIFDMIPYNDVLGVMAQLINIQCAFNWNFADVFIICISLYLTSRLEQVNRRVEAVKAKHVPPVVWRTLREDYSRLTKLVRRVNDAIGEIIFVSFANNLFFICLQLLHTLSDGIRATPTCHPNEPDGRVLQGYEPAVYFVFSFVFLIGRSLSVSLIASRVHIASKEPANALYDVPSEVYCTEVQRFLNQVHGDTVALSGINFFNVKRGLVLTIAGTIVTYELVLMQFTGVTPTAAPA